MYTDLCTSRGHNTTKVRCTLWVILQQSGPTGVSNHWFKFTFRVTSSLHEGPQCWVQYQNHNDGERRGFNNFPGRPKFDVFLTIFCKFFFFTLKKYIYFKNVFKKEKKILVPILDFEAFSFSTLNRTSLILTIHPQMFL